jgi:hypothetical protein
MFDATLLGADAMPGRTHDMKRGALKTVGLCLLLFLSSPAALGGNSYDPSHSGGAKSATLVSPSGVLHSPSLSVPVGAIALDASSGESAPGSTRNDRRLPETLTTYLFLHMTWNECIAAPATTGSCACSNDPWRWLRLHAVTRWPSANR